MQSSSGWGPVLCALVRQIDIYVSQRTQKRLPVGHYYLPIPRAEAFMNLHITMGPLLSLIAGVLILIVPRLLSYIVAIYLIAMGLLGLFGSGAFR